MKYIIILFALVAASVAVNAQDPVKQQTPDQEQITDEELQKYAVAMDSVNDMKETLLEEIGDIVKEEGKMTNSRYNELSKIANDEAKLAAAKATAEEKEVLKKVADKKAEGTEEINTTFQSLARDYVGAESYNKIKKALTTDTELKAKYETMLKELDDDESKP